MLKATQLIELYRANVMHRDEVTALLPAALADQPEAIHLAVNDKLIAPEFARSLLGLSYTYQPGQSITAPTFPPPLEPDNPDAPRP